MAAGAADVTGSDASAAFASLAARLTARARLLAQARGENAALARKADPRRWRKAGLLWPQFVKG